MHQSFCPKNYLDWYTKSTPTKNFKAIKPILHSFYFLFYSIFLPVYPFGFLRDAPTALAWVRLILTPLPITQHSAGALFLHSPRIRSRLHASPVVWENLNAARENPHQKQPSEESNLSRFA